MFKDNFKRPYYLLRELKKFKPQQKEHIPLLNCSRLRIELSTNFKNESNQQGQRIEWIWNKLHNEDFIIITSDNKKHKLNAGKILQKRGKKSFGTFAASPGKIMLSTHTDGRMSGPNLGVMLYRPLKKEK